MVSTVFFTSFVPGTGTCAAQFVPGPTTFFTSTVVFPAVQGGFKGVGALPAVTTSAVFSSVGASSPQCPSDSAFTIDPATFAAAVGALGLLGFGALGVQGLGGAAAPPPPPPPPPPAPQGPTTVNANQLPGQVLGGQLPIGISPVVLTALALVPAGATAVSVFPPFDPAKPRTVNVVAGVIFRENTNKRKKKRSPRRNDYYQYEEQPGFFGNALGKTKNFLYKLWSPFYRAGRKIKSYMSADSYQDDTYYYVDGYDQSSQFDDGQDEIDYDNDLFGFRIVISKDEFCTLGVTCDENGNRIRNGNVVKRQSLPPRSYRYDHYYSISRQTAEEFSADGPPECRTTLNPGGCQDDDELAG